MKKLLALILAAAMSLSLAACGNGSTSSGGGSTSEPAGTPAASSGEETGWVPTEDIEFVIPFGAGGGNDVMVRKILEIVEKYEYAESNAMTVSFMPYQEFAAYAAEMLEDYTTYLGMIPQD